MPPDGSLALEVSQVSRRFGALQALDQVTIKVARQQIHALLGPNGAGKTTLLRIVTGLLQPDSGEVTAAGVAAGPDSREYRKAIAMVPSGDRTFYLRISGLENLAFFARLDGRNRRDSLQRARKCLEAVGLTEAADRRVGVYSHGMQKRLAMARALLGSPSVLVVDEATHDLDPEGARRIRALVVQAAERGAAVLWATQRLEEVKGFAQVVTVLRSGRVRFSGSVPELLATVELRRFLLRVRTGSNVPPTADQLAAALAQRGSVQATPDVEHFIVTLEDEVLLGDVMNDLGAHGIQVVACQEERSQLEEAFLRLTGDGEQA
ncbi:MAG TPA: ABC transporter ATP-binding protein [Acidimicrobiales bacterium]|nr:ABC transporter ATP-binding protein [Acidimicrobiales bacterium]